MTCRQAGIATGATLIALMVLPVGIISFVCTFIIFGIWAVVFLTQSAKLREMMRQGLYEKMDAKEEKKKTAPDTDPLIGLLDEDMYLWQELWGGDK